MYDFHYNFVKKNFDAELLFTDTDSLAYEIKSKNIYEEFLSGNICLILVTIQNDSKLFDPTNKKFIEKIKDEFGGIIVDKFVGLKSKICSIKKKMTIKNAIQQKE